MSDVTKARRLVAAKPPAKAARRLRAAMRLAIAPETPAIVAESVGLRYVDDNEPELTRIKKGSGFAFVRADGSTVRDRTTRERLRHLAIPPAWTSVWISAHADGHIQATGRDARGRKQYLYHPDWRRQRDANKFDRMLALGQKLPSIRRRIEADLKLSGLPREKVLATVVRLLEETHIRVGNEEYAKTNGSFGLTTLKNRHVRVSKDQMRFTFKGKSGVKHAVSLADRRLARIVRQCQELTGQELFQYRDDEGQNHRIDSTDVNAYLRDLSGMELTAKDFRTWAGSVLATEALLEAGVPSTQAEAKRLVNDAIEVVAKRLGNTRTICRKCYVHPRLLTAFTDGKLQAVVKRKTAALPHSHFSASERQFLKFLMRGL